MIALRLGSSLPEGATVPRPIMPSGSQKNASIDVYRGVAALLVAAFHIRSISWIGVNDLWHTYGLSLTPQTLLGYATFPIIWGRLGVPIFFVLSGYCIHRGQARQRATTGDYGLSAGNFWLRRFLRIYPVLFCALVLTAVCDRLAAMHGHAISAPDGDGLAILLTNLASLQGVAGPTFGSNSPLWTLAIEAQFYLLYPLLLFVMRRMDLRLVLVALFAAGILAHFTLGVRGYVFFLPFYVEWYFGVLVAEWQDREVLSRWFGERRVRVLTTSLGAIGMAAGCAISFTHLMAAFHVWALSFALILYAGLHSPGGLRGIGARALAYLGDFSFSIYIIHLPVALLLEELLFSSEKHLSLLPFATLMVAAVAIARLFYLGVEKPALAASAAVKRWRARPPAALPVLDRAASPP